MALEGVLQIAIGTESNYKINAIKAAIYNLDIDFEGFSGKAPSEVSEQPRLVGETKLGSINRAKNILKIHPHCDCGIGVEFGYEPIDGKYYMVCWASILTKDGKVFSEASSTLELPKSLAEGLVADISVNDGLDDVMSKAGNNYAARKFNEMLRKRVVIEECVRNVVLRWIFDGVVY